MTSAALVKHVIEAAGRGTKGLNPVGFVSARTGNSEKCRTSAVRLRPPGADLSLEICSPPGAAVITNTGLEHTEIPGSTLEEISREKAGIVKPGDSFPPFFRQSSISKSPGSRAREKEKET